METTMTEIANDILQLPLRDRAFLAHRLIQSLDHLSDADADALWLPEIKRRSAEIADNRVECRPVETVVATIRRKLQNARSHAS